MGDFHKASEQFKKALERKLQDPDANNGMEALLLIQQRYDEALRCFKTVIDHNQDEESAYEWINWSMVFWQQEKKEEAMEIFRKGMSVIDKASSPEDERQEIIKTYTRIQMTLERKILQTSEQEEKIRLEKTIAGIRWALELVEGLKEEKS